MMKAVVLFALLVVAAIASESPADTKETTKTIDAETPNVDADGAMEKKAFNEVGPVGKPKSETEAAQVAAPLIAKLRADSNCAGDRCEPAKASCDPTIVGDCENDMLPPTKISCDSIQHCGPCTLHLHCGYINSKNKCVEGGAAGPKEGTAPVGDWDFAYCSKDPCSVYQSCSACSADPMCGWCSSTNSCVEGSASGPWLNKCNKQSFSFDSCAMSVETPTVVTSSSMQANLQESAMLMDNQ